MSNSAASIYRYIWCISDQFNWSELFILVVMIPGFYPNDPGSRPALAGCFYSHVYISPPTSNVKNI